MNSLNFIKINRVEAKPDFTLLITFETGEIKSFDFKPLLSLSIYEKLNNPIIFAQAINDVFGVIWNDDIDIASEVLYKKGVLVA
ncbi:MAG: DUF2442 domain-containing protein [Deltaproteobacteria bacterium]|jgi:hypothetical protein|nr:DUF2442 domain-containing protein [Deltaproteobacteria bacterium]